MGALSGLSNEDLQGIEAWTPVEVAVRYRAVAARMIEVVSERRQAGIEFSIARAEHQKNVATVRVREKNAAAERGHKLTSADLDALVGTMTNDTSLRLDLAEQAMRTLDMEARTLDSVLGMLRSVGRDARELAGGSR